MLALLKLLQSLVKTLNSDGTPGQIAAGFALGAALGLTPIMNLHNLAILLLLAVLNVSFGAGMLAWAIFVPVGFLLDPLFNAVGSALLLGAPSLRPFWAAMANVPVLPFTNFNNTVVLGSVVVWLLLALPIFLLARYGVLRYRATVYERLRRMRLYHVVTASKAYNVYRWFRP